MASILSSQQNFRDLGGIRIPGGFSVRPGLLFRSGDFFTLTPEDLGTLEAMKLACIVDFRARREIDRRPDREITTVKEVVHIGIHDAARDRAEKYLAENDARGLETVLVGDYVRMVNHHQQDFRRFLELLATTEHLPLAYHCAAGKDRTGLATVFLLSALGADMETIWDDYMATNEHARSYTEKIIRKVTESGQNGLILRPLLEVRREYLEAALDEINRIAGSLDRFVGDFLKADRARLRERYLAPVSEN